MIQETPATAIVEADNDIDLSDCKALTPKAFRRYKRQLELMSIIHAEIAPRHTLSSDIAPRQDLEESNAQGEPESYVALFFPCNSNLTEELP
jgi:hypothetical protein